MKKQDIIKNANESTEFGKYGASRVLVDLLVEDGRIEDLGLHGQGYSFNADDNTIINWHSQKEMVIIKHDNYQVINFEVKRFDRNDDVRPWGV